MVCCWGYGPFTKLHMFSWVLRNLFETGYKVTYFGQVVKQRNLHVCHYLPALLMTLQPAVIPISFTIGQCAHNGPANERCNCSSCVMITAISSWPLLCRTFEVWTSGHSSKLPNYWTKKNAISTHRPMKGEWKLYKWTSYANVCCNE